MEFRFPDVEAASAAAVASNLARGTVIDVPSNPTVLPSQLCLKLACLPGQDQTPDWRFATGFDAENLERVIIDALPHMHPARRDVHPNNDCVFLALAFLRSGLPIFRLSRPLSMRPQTLESFILRGLRGLSSSFATSNPEYGSPSLDELLDAEQKAAIPAAALGTRFIVDGKHIACSRVGDASTRQAFCSHKLRTAALGFQAVVTNFGECVHVAAGARAAEHDIAVWGRHRNMVLARLRTLISGDPLILADLGYRSATYPEIITNNEPNPTLNSRRLVVENFFGRMVQVFASSRYRFRLGLEHFDTFIRALCHATNRTIAASPLRNDDFLHYRANISAWHAREDAHRISHRVAVTKSRRRNSQNDDSAIDEINVDCVELPAKRQIT